MTERPATLAFVPGPPSPTAPVAAPAVVSPGRASRRYDGYIPERVLSHGPDGTAISAKHPDDHTEVELRFLAPAQQIPARWTTLCNQISTLELIQHRNYRALLSHDLDGDEPMMTLAAVPGKSLAEWVSDETPLEPALVAQFAEQIAGALAAAHRMQLTHGLLNSHTLWIDSTEQPWIELTGTNVLSELSELSTWDRACRAPELSKSDPEPASDVFALAMLALGALVGGDPTANAGRVTAGGVIEGLRVILSQALLRDPDDRPSAAQMQQQLRGWLQEQKASAAMPDARATKAIAREFERVSVSAPAMKLAPNARLGRYYLVRQLGEGGMGEVWEGVDLGSSATVALKMLRPQVANDPLFLSRFRKEARTLAAVKNPYIANLIEINEDRGVHFLAMEYVQGTSVANVLSEHGPLDEREALTIIADACRALTEPHRTGVVHRDIKPDNMMFVRSNEPLPNADEGRQRIKVCDFGIARQEDAADAQGATQMTREGSLL